MNNITENDIAQIEQQAIKHLTKHLENNGIDSLMKQLIEISARVSSNMIWEYHKLISDQSS